MEGRQAETQPDRHVHFLAILPISFLSEQGDRLAGWRDRRAVGEHYRNLFASSVWVYPLHAYRARLSEQMGHAVAEAVWSRQREMFNQADAGAGQSMESAFTLIDAALDAARVWSDEPESRVARTLLLGMPESPDYVGGITRRTGSMPTLQVDVQVCLARCLLHARVELLAACSELFVREHDDC